MQTIVCSDCHQELPVESFRHCHSGLIRQEFCVDCGRKRSHYRSCTGRRSTRHERNRPDRRLEDIPDSYGACLVISEERRAEIIRSIEG